MSEEAKAADKNSSGMSPLNYLFVLLIGAYLGILFIKSEVARWERVHDMFLLCSSEPVGPSPEPVPDQSTLRSGLASGWHCSLWPEPYSACLATPR